MILLQIVSQTIRKGAVHIIDDTPKDIDWWAIIASLTALVLFIFILYDRFKKPIISGKLSCDFQIPGILKIKSEHTFAEINGSYFVLKIFLFCTRKDFTFKNVEASLMINDELIKAEITTPLIFRTSLPDGAGGQTEAEIIIDPEKHLVNNSILPLDKNNDYYIITFIRQELTTLSSVLSVHLEFTNLRNEKTIVILYPVPDHSRNSDMSIFKPMNQALYSQKVAFYNKHL